MDRIEFKTVIRGPGGKKWEHGQNRLLEVTMPGREALDGDGEMAGWVVVPPHVIHFPGQKHMPKRNRY